MFHNGFSFRSPFRFPFHFFVHVSVDGLVHGLVDGLVHGLVDGLVDQWSDRNMAKIQPFINNFLTAVKFPETKGSYMLLHRSDLNISENFRQRL